MRSGSRPLEAGIWSLSRPAFLQPVASGVVAAEVVAELEAADELEALASLAGRPAADARLDLMIAVIRSRLSALKERSWYACWSESRPPNLSPRPTRRASPPYLKIQRADAEAAARIAGTPNA